VKRIATTLALYMGLVACGSDTRVSQSDLIILDDYPATLNLTTLSGTIKRIDGCISISDAHDSVFVPLFRPGDTLGGPHCVPVSGANLKLNARNFACS